MLKRGFGRVRHHLVRLIVRLCDQRSSHRRSDADLGLATALGGLWWSQRREAKVGMEALMGREVEVRKACRPVGEVRVRGEIWKARCDQGADAGDPVRIVGLFVGRDGNRRWVRATGTDLVSDADAEAYVTRARGRDSDLWVVEIEDRKGRDFLTEEKE